MSALRDNLSLSHPLSPVLGIPLSELVASEDEVDKVIERSLLLGMPDIAIGFGWRIIQQGQIKGLQLAKLLYEIDRTWPQFSNNTDDDVKDAVFKGMGVPPETFRKYVMLWASIFANDRIPKQYRAAMRNKPMGGLIAISVAAREGEFNDEDWKELAEAHDKAGMLVVRDRVRGVGPRENGRIVTWERDGRLSARRGSEGPEDCGFLPHTTGIELVDETVQWIIRTLGIIER